MGFFTGIQLYGKAFGILFSRKFWWFLLFPVIILLLLFIGGNILISLAGDSLYGLIEAKLTAWVGGISWLQWVTTTTSVLIKIVFLPFRCFRRIYCACRYVAGIFLAVRTDGSSSYRKGISL